MRNPHYYGCGARAYGGHCENTIAVRRTLIQDVIVDGIKADLRRPGLIEEAELEVERRARLLLKNREAAWPSR
jgi:hypothetical protein